MEKYECSECGKNFKRKSALKLHSNSHRGEEPFICIDCGEEFTGESTFANHVLLHIQTEEQPYQQVPSTGGARKKPHTNYDCLICNEIFRYDVKEVCGGVTLMNVNIKEEKCEFSSFEDEQLNELIENSEMHKEVLVSEVFIKEESTYEDVVVKEEVDPLE
ncbi:Zinc finger protein 41-like 1 [Homarus americanus]|uniref:Zinc finger protein 41-like 1 n=1 Tax=Homarus americanus TaxID=6706 RepID=A0A8J5MMF5_HOMAM|nr:Zinc finger protein 41-like 1 [Homarus americanus]